jgi:hypothetical protein
MEARNEPNTIENSGVWDHNFFRAAFKNMLVRSQELNPTSLIFNDSMSGTKHAFNLPVAAMEWQLV